MGLKLSQVKTLRNQNQMHHNKINDSLKSKTKFSLIKKRLLHARALRQDPFFDKLLKKQIIVKAGEKKFIILGTGFKEQGNFKRSVIAIDDKGRAIFLAQVLELTKEGSKTHWLPYSIVKKTRTKKGNNWSYAKLEPSTQKEKQEILALSQVVQGIIKHINFESIPPRKINQIKRFF